MNLAIFCLSVPGAGEFDRSGTDYRAKDYSTMKAEVNFIVDRLSCAA